MPICHQRKESPLGLSSLGNTTWDCFANSWPQLAETTPEEGLSDWPVEKKTPVPRGLHIKLLTLKELVGMTVFDLESAKGGYVKLN